MQLLEREMPDEVAHLARIFLEKLGIDLGVVPLAEGAIVVRVLDDGHRRVGGALKGPVLEATHGPGEDHALSHGSASEPEANAEGQQDSQWIEDLCRPAPAGDSGPSRSGIADCSLSVKIVLRIPLAIRHVRFDPLGLAWLLLIPLASFGFDVAACSEVPTLSLV
jgi:hypothetical protein